MKKLTTILVTTAILLVGCASLPPEAKVFENSLENKNYDRAVEVVPFLDLDQTRFFDGTFDKVTALNLAAQHGNVDVILALIEHGADVNQKTNLGSNAIGRATLYGNFEAVEVLLANGAIPREKDIKLIGKKRDGLKIAQLYQAAGYNIPNSINEELSGDSNNGFQWGKALALGVGTVAGGGLKLDTDTQATIISGIVLDSMEDTSGTSNLNEAVSNAVKPVATPSISTVRDTSNEVGLATGAETSETPSDIVQSDTTSGNEIPTPSESSRKCGISSYSLAEEQAEKDRLGAIMQSKLANVPKYDYKTRNQLSRDWERGMSDWRKARHEACGINTNRTSRVTIE